MRAACRDWTRTIFLRGPDEDYTMSTKGRMLERLRVIMAGRAAEQVCTVFPSAIVSPVSACTFFQHDWGRISCLSLQSVLVLVVLPCRWKSLYLTTTA